MVEKSESESEAQSVTMIQVGTVGSREPGVGNSREVGVGVGGAETISRGDKSRCRGRDQVGDERDERQRQEKMGAVLDPWGVHQGR